MIAGEARLLRIAVQFLTRLPVGHIETLESGELDRSAKYFPLVGALVGAIAAATLVASSLIFPDPIPIVLALIAGTAVTGALHEDGLADAADGLWGGATRDRRLEIMKDSRIGAYGVLTLGFVLALKSAALSGLGPITAAAALIATHAGARLTIVIALRLLPYAGDPETAKVKPLTAASNGEFALATAFGVAPGLALLPLDAWIIAWIVGFLAATSFGLIAMRRIQGYTGDILGAIEQLFEVGFLLGAAAVISGPG
ncbi:MAG: adenosylcobinamide-GDP ribazoletransferase [Hyphomicrobium sp.]